MKHKVKRKSINNRKIKKERKQLIISVKKISGKLRSIGLKCKYCEREMRVRTTHIELYTKEVRENWTCGLCEKSKR